MATLARNSAGLLVDVLSRVRFRLPLSSQQHRLFADAQDEILDTSALFLLDPRLHPAFEKDWPVPVPAPTSADCRVIKKPCGGAVAAMGQPHYIGQTVRVACCPVIAEVLDTFLSHGPGPRLNSVFDRCVQSATDDSTQMALRALGGLLSPCNSSHSSISGLWVLRAALELSQGKLRSQKIENDLSRKFATTHIANTGFQDTKPASTAATIARQIYDPARLPKRVRNLRDKYRVSLQNVLAQQFLNS